MGRRRLSFACLLASSLIPARCGAPDIPASTMEKIRLAHGQILTVDARVDSTSDRHRPGSLSPTRMEKDGLDAAVFYVPVPRAGRTAEGHRLAKEAAFDGIARLEGTIREMSGRVGLALSTDDAYRLEKEGRRAVYLALASGDAIGRDLSLLGAFHARDVRLLALCDGAGNEICESVVDKRGREDRGLSEFGERVVAECNRLGLLIDVAGCSERSILDVLAASRAPVVCTRAAARALSDVPGNLADGTIEAIAARGGVIMVTFDPAALVPSSAGRRSRVSDIADHIEHVAKLARWSGVGIGSGFGGGDGTSGGPDETEMLNVTVELLRRGLGEHALEAVWGRNFMRVLSEVASFARTGARGRP